VISLGSDKEKERERERKGGKERRRKEENLVKTYSTLDVLGSTILDRRGSESICRGNISKIGLQQNDITHRNKGSRKLLVYEKFSQYMLFLSAVILFVFHEDTLHFHLFSP